MLRDAIQKLAETFATEVLRAIRASSLEDIAGSTGVATSAPPKRRGRPPGPSKTTAPSRATATTPKKEAALTMGGRRPSRLPALVEAVRATPDGLSSGQLREVLRMSQTGLSMVLKRAIAEGQIRRVGENRDTRYVAA